MKLISYASNYIEVQQYTQYTIMQYRDAFAYLLLSWKTHKN